MDAGRTGNKIEQYCGSTESSQSGYSLSAFLSRHLNSLPLIVRLFNVDTRTHHHYDQHQHQRDVVWIHTLPPPPPACVLVAPRVSAPHRPKARAKLTK